MSLLRNYCWAWSLHLSKLVCPQRLFTRAPEFSLSRATAVAGSFPSHNSPRLRSCFCTCGLFPCQSWLLAGDRPPPQTCSWFLFVSSEGTGPRWLLGTPPQPGWGGTWAPWVWGAMGMEASTRSSLSPPELPLQGKTRASHPIGAPFPPGDPRLRSTQ